MKKQLLILFLLIRFLGFSQNEYRLAENYYRENEYEKALQIYKNLYQQNNYNSTYLKRLISCYQETNNFKTAENLLKNNLKKQPRLYYLNVLLGYNFDKQQQKELAIVFYEKALQGIQQNPNYGGIVGGLFKEYNLLEYAINAYEQTMRKKPKANYHFQVAQIYGEQGDFDKMFTAFIDLVDKNEQYLETVKRYVSRYISDDRQNETNVIFRKVVLRKSFSKPKIIWNELLSWLFSQQKEYSKALTQEKALYARNPIDFSAIMSLGVLAYENKAYNSAQQCFDFVHNTTTIKEDKLSALLYQTKILSALNAPETADFFKNIFRTYGENQSTLEIQIGYADFLTFHLNKADEAIKILEKALTYATSKFEKAQIKLQLGDVLIFTGKFNKALVYFSQIQSVLKNHSLGQQARFKVAQTSYFKGDFEWAKAQLKVLKSASTQLIANDALRLYLLISDNEPVDSIPSGLIEYARAEAFSFQHKNKEATVLLHKIITEFKGMPIEDDALYSLALLATKEKRFSEAIKNFEKIIALNLEGVLVDDCFYELAKLHEEHLEEPKKAAAYYQKILFDYPSSIYMVEARKKFRKLRGDATNN